jgi:transposase
VDYKGQISQINPEDLVFVDESGANISLARLYARAPKGKRVYGSRPLNRGQNVTTLGALSLKGVIAVMSVEGSTDGDVVLAYVERVLTPNLQPGQVVIMDNLKAHKVKGVKETIESVGARLMYLPSYSPDLSPIEQCWSKLKQYLRAKAARTYEALEQALTEAIKTITVQDALGWFIHCGYCTALK